MHFLLKMPFILISYWEAGTNAVHILQMSLWKLSSFLMVTLVVRDRAWLQSQVVSNSAAFLLTINLCTASSLKLN